MPNAALPAGCFPPEIPVPGSTAKSSLEQPWASPEQARAPPRSQMQLQTKWQSNAHRPDLSGHKLRFNEEQTSTSGEANPRGTWARLTLLVFSSGL